MWDIVKALFVYDLLKLAIPLITGIALCVVVFIGAVIRATIEHMKARK